MRTRFRKELKRFACLGLAAVIASTAVPCGFAGNEVMTVEASSDEAKVIYMNLTNALSDYNNKLSSVEKSLKKSSFKEYCAFNWTRKEMDGRIGSSVLSKANTYFFDAFRGGTLYSKDASVMEFALINVIARMSGYDWSSMCTKYPKYSELNSTEKDDLMSYINTLDLAKDTLEKKLNMYKDEISELYCTANGNGAGTLQIAGVGSTKKVTSYAGTDGYFYVDLSQFYQEGYEVSGLTDLSTNKLYSGLYAKVPQSSVSDSTKFYVVHRDVCDIYVDFNGGKTGANYVCGVSEASSNSILESKSVSISSFNAKKSGSVLTSIKNNTNGNTYSLQSGATSVTVPINGKNEIYLEYQWDNTSTATATPTSTVNATATVKPTPTSVSNYKITFDCNSGTSDSGEVFNIEATNGYVDLAIASAKVSKEGHVLKGWATSKTATTNIYNPIQKMPLNYDMKLYAIWEVGSGSSTPVPSPNSTPVSTTEDYTVLVHGNGGKFEGEGISQAVYKRSKNGVYDMSWAPKVTKEGYELVGWNTCQDGSGVSYPLSGEFKVDKWVTVFAQWKAVGNTSTPTPVPEEVKTITVDANGGTFGTDKTMTKTYKEGESVYVSIPTAPDGYVFDSYVLESSASASLDADVSYSKELGTGKIISAKITPSEFAEFTLVAQWRKKDSPTSTPYATIPASPSITEKPVVTEKPSTTPYATIPASSSITEKPVVTEKPSTTPYVPGYPELPSEPNVTFTVATPSPVPSSSTDTPSVSTTVTPIPTNPVNMETDKPEETVVPTDSPTPEVSNGPINSNLPSGTEKPSTPSATEKPAGNIKCSVKKVSLGKGEKWKIPVTNVKGRKVVYVSSNSCVKVLATGVVKGSKTGSSKVYVVCDGKKLSVNITVKKAPKSVKLSAKKIVLKKGQSKKLKVYLTKGSASKKLKWKTKNKKVATVANGKITAKKKGKTYVAVTTYNGKKTWVEVVVK